MENKKLLIFVSLHVDSSSFSFLSDHCKKTNPFTPVLYADNLFSSLKKDFSETKRLSVAPIGAFPFHSDLLFVNTKDPISSFPFCNLWGLRNFSISRHFHSFIKNELRSLDFSEYSSIEVVGVEAHYFILAACAYLKKQIPGSHLTVVVPDLPQYMNGSDGSAFYRLAKTIDNVKIQKILKRYADGYVFLSDAMTESFDLQGKHFNVLEGIAKEPISEEQIKSVPHRIVYTGRTDLDYSGLALLSEAVSVLKKEDPSYELVVAGSGNGDSFLREKSAEGKLVFLGMLPPNKTLELQETASIFACLRKPLERFKYAFPSKILDYCRIGRPIIFTSVEGLPEEYKKLLFTPTEYSVPGVVDVIRRVSLLSQGELDSVKKVSNQLCFQKGPSNVVSVFGDLFSQYKQ